LQEEIAFLKTSQTKKIHRTSQQLLEKIQDRLLFSSSASLPLSLPLPLSTPCQTLIGSLDSATSPSSSALSEELILEKISQLSLLVNYNSIFLQSVIQHLCSKGLSGDLTQWLCSTSSSLSLYSPSSSSPSSGPSLSLPLTSPSDLHENWSIIWLDHYETIHQRSSGGSHILDSDTFHEVLETKKPNYINLVEFEDGVSYQVFYWPLFSSDSIATATGDTGESLKHSFLSHEGSREERERERSVIGILQCQIRKDSSDPSSFLEQSLAQPLFLSYFNQLLTQIYPHLPSSSSSASSSATESSRRDPEESESEELLSTTDTHHLGHQHDPHHLQQQLQQQHLIDSSLLHTDECQVILSNNFFADLSSLIRQTLVTREEPGHAATTAHSREFMSQVSQVIWDHSCHTQIHAVGVFLRETEGKGEREIGEERDHKEVMLGTIRSTKLRSIQLNDDEDNQSISIQFNPNR
jgi:hypothetical protein